jgi:hypothetical protein
VMTNRPRRLSCSTVPNWWFLASSLLLQRIHRRLTASCSSSALLWTPHCHRRSSTIVPLPPKLRIPFQRPCFMPAMCLFAATPLHALPYNNPYLVLERSPHTFRLQLGDKTDVIATARLKAAVLPPDAPVAEPRCQGWPANGSTVLPSTPGVPARTINPRASSASSKQVSFTTSVVAAPECRPQRLRRPPDRFSVSSLGSETRGRYSDEASECSLCT